MRVQNPKSNKYKNHSYNNTNKDIWKKVKGIKETNKKIKDGHLGWGDQKNNTEQWRKYCPDKFFINIY